MDDIVNAKTELQDLIKSVHVTYKAEPVAVEIRIRRADDYYDESSNINVVFILDQEHKSLDELISPLDYNYDCGYGGQYLYGTVWFTKGIWADRYEYDGSERWAVNRYPSLPVVPATDVAGHETNENLEQS
jgi:hypothetical protein